MSAEPTDRVAANDPKQVIDAQNPWPGLDAFDEGAASYFNGRDTEIAELARLISQSELSVLFGKSGLGKTSLLQAGLFPLLRARGMFPVHVRLDVLDRQGALIEQLSRALLRESGIHGVHALPADFAGTLWERLHLRDSALWSATNRLLIPLFVLDQFEEIFTLGAANPDAIERLRIDLADMIENRIPATVVGKLETSSDASEALDVRRQRYKFLLSFREDFLPDVEAWRKDLPSLMRNRLRLREMNADQAFAAVYQTGSAAQLVDERTARDIVRFVGKIPDQPVPEEDDFSQHVIEPALLSLVCWELNKRRQSTVPRQPTISAELLRGSAESIISEFYLRQVAKIPPVSRRFIEEKLLTESGYRTSFPIDEALKQGVLTDKLLRRLVDARLLRIEQQLGVPRVELTHDRLTDVVRNERDKRRRRRRIQFVGGGLVIGFLLVLFVAFNYGERRAAEKQRHIVEQALAKERAQTRRAENAVIEAQAQTLIAKETLAELRTEQEKAAQLTQQIVKEQEQRAAVAQNVGKSEDVLIAELKPEAAEAARRLIAEAKTRGIDVRLISGYRSPAQQAELYARGRTTPGPIVTRSKVSTHNTGLAFDVGIFKNKKFQPGGPEYQIVGAIGRQLGLIWGAGQPDFDVSHFETQSARTELQRLPAQSQ